MREKKLHCCWCGEWNIQKSARTKEGYESCARHYISICKPKQRIRQMHAGR